MVCCVGGGGVGREKGAAREGRLSETLFLALVVSPLRVIKNTGNICVLDSMRNKNRACSDKNCVLS